MASCPFQFLWECIHEFRIFCSEVWCGTRNVSIPIISRDFEIADRLLLDHAFILLYTIAK